MSVPQNLECFLHMVHREGRVPGDSQVLAALMNEGMWNQPCARHQFNNYTVPCALINPQHAEALELYLDPTQRRALAQQQYQCERSQQAQLQAVMQQMEFARHLQTLGGGMPPAWKRGPPTA